MSTAATAATATTAVPSVPCVSVSAHVRSRVIKGCLREIGAIVRTSVRFTNAYSNRVAMDHAFAHRIDPNLRALHEHAPEDFVQFASWVGVDASVEAVREELFERACSLMERRVWRMLVQRAAEGKGRPVFWPIPELRSRAR